MKLYVKYRGQVEVFSHTRLPKQNRNRHMSATLLDCFTDLFEEVKILWSSKHKLWTLVTLFVKCSSFSFYNVAAHRNTISAGVCFVWFAQ